jgi:hypothetical protein
METHAANTKQAGREQAEVAKRVVTSCIFAILVPRTRIFYRERKGRNKA